MRIIGGRHRGRPLRAPAGRDVRPTPDRVREALFNVLLHGAAAFDLEGASVVDVFAGSGALGLEALSRGAGHATFIESTDEALRFIRMNAGRLDEGANTTLLRLDASRLPPPPRAARCPAPLVFLDPPYGTALLAAALRGLARHHWIGEEGLAVVELAASEELQPVEGYQVVDRRLYGRAGLVFLRYRRPNSFSMSASLSST